ncbi:MAG: hypothetical protein WBF77_11890 [Sulfurimonadaceae bacterium]
MMLRTSCLYGALHIIKARRLKTESSFCFIYAFGGFEAKKAKQLAFSYKVSAVGASHIDSGFAPKKAKKLAFS